MNVLIGVLVVIFVVSFGDCVRADNESIGSDLIEQGRTLVHHAVKRWMIILPAVFFKLGIAFTLLILVTLVAVNNGLIGFMLLVVGLSSVLARLQEARRPLPYVQPAFHAAAPIWARSGDAGDAPGPKMTAAKLNNHIGYGGQAYATDLGGFYSTSIRNA